MLSLGLFEFSFASSAELKPLRGGELAELIKKSKAEFVLVNLWASWCDPCRKEFPDLVKFRNAKLSDKIEFIFISVDTKTERPEAEKFLKANNVNFTTYIKDGLDSEFISSVGKLAKKWDGALPTTLIFDSSAKVLEQFDGEVTFTRLDQEISKLRKQKK